LDICQCAWLFAFFFTFLLFSHHLDSLHFFLYSWGQQDVLLELFLLQHNHILYDHGLMVGKKEGKEKEEKQECAEPQYCFFKRETGGDIRKIRREKFYETYHRNYAQDPYCTFSTFPWDCSVYFLQQPLLFEFEGLASRDYWLPIISWLYITMILSFYKLFRKEISIYLLLKLLRKGMTSPGVKKKKTFIVLMLWNIFMGFVGAPCLYTP